MQLPPAQTSNPSGNTTKITAEPTRNSNRKRSSMATKQDWQRNPRRTGRGSSNPSGNTAKLTAEPTRNSLWKQTGRLVRRPSPAEALLPQEAPQEAQKGSKKGQEAQKGPKRLSRPGVPNSAGGPERLQKAQLARRPGRRSSANQTPHFVFIMQLLYTCYTLIIHLIYT